MKNSQKHTFKVRQEGLFPEGQSLPCDRFDILAGVWGVIDTGHNDRDAPHVVRIVDKFTGNVELDVTPFASL